MALFAHLSIAISFIVLFYLCVNYCAIKLELQAIKEALDKIEFIKSTQVMSATENAVREKQLNYAIERYNKAVDHYLNHKGSVFVIPVLKLFKNLNQTYVTINL